MPYFNGFGRFRLSQGGISIALKSLERLIFRLSCRLTPLSGIWNEETGWSGVWRETEAKEN